MKNKKELLKRIETLKLEIQNLENIVNEPEDEYSEAETFFSLFKKCKPVWHKNYSKSLYFIYQGKTYFEASDGLLYCANEIWAEMEKFGEYKEWSKVINLQLHQMGLKMNVVGCGNWEHCSGNIGSEYKDSVIKSALEG